MNPILCAIILPPCAGGTFMREKKRAHNRERSTNSREHANRASKNVWPVTGQLISPISQEAEHALQILPNILDEIFPPSSSHRKELPEAISSLSLMLTSERSQLRYPYWHRPAYVGAYLHYFMSWNLLRLISLLQALNLDPPLEHNGKLPLFIDAGSGPLTLSLALWLAKPEWRTLPIRVHAIDAVRRPLELGKKVFHETARQMRQPAWEIVTSTGPLYNACKIAQHQAGDFYPWLIAAANVLNELHISTKQHGGNIADGDPLPGVTNLLDAWEPFWQAGAKLLFVEPGTRQGGTTIMRMREKALELGLHPVSPCTHSGPCPLLRYGNATHSASWCHFTFPPRGAPAWLKELSRNAGLYKKSLSLSMLMLGKPKQYLHPAPCFLPCRIISGSFKTPFGTSRYGCSSAGLTLLPESEGCPSGAICLAQKPASFPKKDTKSGAIILTPFEKPRKARRPHGNLTNSSRGLHAPHASRFD